MAMSLDSGFKFRNFYFSPDSVLNFRKCYQIWGKLAQEQESYRQKNKFGSGKHPPPPPVLIGLNQDLSILLPLTAHFLIWHVIYLSLFHWVETGLLKPNLINLITKSVKLKRRKHSTFLSLILIHI